MSDSIIYRLDEIAKFSKGINYSLSDYTDNGSGITFITIKSILKGGGYDKTGLKTIRNRFSQQDFLAENDLLIAITDLTRDGDIVGSPIIIPKQLNGSVASMDLVKITPNKSVACARYLYYFLMLPSTRRYFVNHSSGSTVLHLETRAILKLNLLVPSLDYQKRIATILSTVDEVIEKTETAIEKYKAIKTGMMQDLFTRGIDVKTGKLRPSFQEDPELYKETELGWIPKEWEIVKIGDFSKIKGGKRMPVGKEFSDALTPFPYLRVTDMQNGSIDQSDLKYVPVEIEPLIRSYKISVDDVYVTIAGTLGLFGTIPTNLDQSQLTENAARICEFDKTVYDRDFIKHQCNSRIIQSQVIREIGVGGGVPKLALYRITKFLFLKPTISEQKAIVERIKVIESKLYKESVSLNKYKQIKQGLMADLLTGSARTI
ncbi:MAG: restriction endonuclease subunit S [Candidatus Cloacimonas acidaminovorans]|nr:restriction endonuclease subunit S [Candidatus Cloacimonas acidaminovorans]